MRLLLAYIDPGSGSMVLQGLVGGAMAVAYAGRKLGLRALRSVGNFFKRSRTPEQADSANRLD
jgi:hypothetical protein